MQEQTFRKICEEYGLIETRVGIGAINGSGDIAYTLPNILFTDCIAVITDDYNHHPYDKEVKVAERVVYISQFSRRKGFEHIPLRCHGLEVVDDIFALRTKIERLIQEYKGFIKKIKAMEIQNKMELVDGMTM